MKTPNANSSAVTPTCLAQFAGGGGLRISPAYRLAARCATAIPYCPSYRICQPTDLSRGNAGTVHVHVVQGRKEGADRQDRQSLRQRQLCVAAIDLPVSGQIVEADEDAPYYGVRIDLDPKDIAAFIIELKHPAPPKRSTRVGAYVEESDAELHGDFLAPDPSAKKAEDIPAMSRILKQESCPPDLGAERRRAVSTPCCRIIRTRRQRRHQWIKQNYSDRCPIEKLAKQVRNERVDPASSLQGDHGDESAANTRSRRVCWKRAACSWPALSATVAYKAV